MDIQNPIRSIKEVQAMTGISNHLIARFFNFYAIEHPGMCVIRGGQRSNTKEARGFYLTKRRRLHFHRNNHEAREQLKGTMQT
jgi:hypothetical protein